MLVFARIALSLSVAHVRLPPHPCVRVRACGRAGVRSFIAICPGNLAYKEILYIHFAQNSSTHCQKAKDINGLAQLKNFLDSSVGAGVKWSGQQL